MLSKRYESKLTLELGYMCHRGVTVFLLGGKVMTIVFNPYSGPMEL